MDNVVIREAKEIDMSQLLVLARKLATSFDIEPDRFRDVFTSVLTLDHMYLAVAELDSKLLGYVLGNIQPCFYASGIVSSVEEIFVEENYRGLAIGRKLMNSFEIWSQSKNSRLISLATRRAAPFYLALGYEDSGTYFKKNL